MAKNDNKSSISKMSKDNKPQIRQSKKKDVINNVIPQDMELDIIMVDDEEDGDDYDASTEKINYISQAGYDKLKAELDDLEQVKLPAIIERVKEAISYGDLRENVEYETAVNDKGFAETRIAELKHILKHAVIKNDDGKKDTSIMYGSNVTFEVYDYDPNSTNDIDSMEEVKGTTHTVHIVSSSEINSLDNIKHHISFDSPIGIALEGKGVGDTARVRSPIGIYYIRIIDIN